MPAGKGPRVDLGKLPAVVRYVRDDWRAIRPVVEWISEFVGETTMPMLEPGRR